MWMFQHSETADPNFIYYLCITQIELQCTCSAQQCTLETHSNTWIAKPTTNAVYKQPTLPVHCICTPVRSGLISGTVLAWLKCSSDNKPLSITSIRWWTLSPISLLSKWCLILRGDMMCVVLCGSPVTMRWLLLAGWRKTHVIWALPVLYYVFVTHLSSPATLHFMTYKLWVTRTWHYTLTRIY